MTFRAMSSEGEENAWILSCTNTTNDDFCFTIQQRQCALSVAFAPTLAPLYTLALSQLRSQVTQVFGPWLTVPRIIALFYPLVWSFHK